MSQGDIKEQWFWNNGNIGLAQSHVEGLNEANLEA